MTTNKFTNLSIKKLYALLETASEEDKELIMQEIEVREADVISPKPEEPKVVKRRNKTRMTDTECGALAEEWRQYVYRRCQVVPFNSVEWVDGYVAGIFHDRRANKVMVAVKTEDNRRIVKVCGSPLLKLLDTSVPLEEIPAPRRKKRAGRLVLPDWDSEEMNKEIDSLLHNIGRMCSFERYSSRFDENLSGIGITTGRIVAITPDKKAQRLMYRIEVEGSDKAIHKMVDADTLTIAEGIDEEGMTIQTKYINRRNASRKRAPLTPEDRVLSCEAKVQKVKDKIAELHKVLEQKTAQLEQARRELNAYLDAQAEGSESLL